MRTSGSECVIASSQVLDIRLGDKGALRVCEHARERAFPSEQPVFTSTYWGKKIPTGEHRARMERSLVKEYSLCGGCFRDGMGKQTKRAEQYPGGRAAVSQ